MRSNRSILFLIQGKKCLTRHGEADTRQGLEREVSLEDIQFRGATNDYHREPCRSDAMSMPQTEDIMTGK